jgi:hypothetical protein
MRSRLGDAARDVAEGKITLEEVTRAIMNAIRDRNLRLADQGAFYNPPEQTNNHRIGHESFQPIGHGYSQGQRAHSRVHAQRQTPPFIKYHQ